jgi:LysR family nod box-dependent transcriptional activator
MIDNIRKVDLNLLLVLDTLFQERSVSRAAGRLGLSQSAISQALSRLRSLFDDQLLVWNGRTMQPTATCERLAPKLRSIISQIRDALDDSKFDESLMERDFVIATADYVEFLLGGGLLKAVEQDYSALSVYFIDIKRPMVEGHGPLEYELFILPKGSMNVVGMRNAHLWNDRHVGVVSASNRRVGDKLTLEEFRSLPHVGYSTDPRILFSPEIKSMADQGIDIHYNILTSDYLLLPFLILETDGVAIVQKRLANRLSNIINIRTVELPFELPELDLMLYWHPSFDRDPSHSWLRSKIIEIAAAMEPSY